MVTLSMFASTPMPVQLAEGVRYRSAGRFDVLVDVDLNSGAVSLRVPPAELERLRAHVAGK